MSIKKFLDILDGKQQLNEDISECGEMPMQQPTPLTMNLNLSAQGIESIKDVLNLINMKDQSQSIMTPSTTEPPAPEQPDELHRVVKTAGLPVPSSNSDNRPEDEGVMGALGGGAIGGAVGGPLGALTGAAAGSSLQNTISDDDDMSMSEYGGTSNFTVDDIKELEKMGDIDAMKNRARELINASSKKKMKPEKIAYFMQAIDKMNRPMEVVKLMYDLLLSGEGHGVIGSKGSMSKSSYRRKFDDSFDNEPEESYQDKDYMIKDLSGGLNKPHKQYRKGYPGADNAMSIYDESIDTIKHRLIREYEEFKESDEDLMKLAIQNIPREQMMDLVDQLQQGELSLSQFNQAVQNAAYTDYSMRRGEMGYDKMDHDDANAWEREKGDWDDLDDRETDYDDDDENY